MAPLLGLSPASLAIPPLLPGRAPAGSAAATCLPASSLFRSSRSLSLPEPAWPLRCHLRRRRFILSASSEDPPASGYSIQTLRVPETWLAAPKAIEESEWLRKALHQWLDDEFCPEETNVEISKVAAQSYQESLLAGNPDMGDILLKMAMDLQSLSYQESFHGPFSAANAAVRLITQRMQSSS